MRSMSRCLALVLVSAVQGWPSQAENPAGGGQSPVALSSQHTELIEKAEKLLEVEPPTIVKKPTLPPSGDRRDYQSLSIYWWPNPINGGTPYLYVDGARNPEADQFDEPKVREFAEKIEVLTKAYALTGEEVFARKARAWLHVWFLDDETRMNPHLRYAQAVPGWMDGTPMGILEGLPLARKVPAAVAILYERRQLPEEEYQGIRTWFSGMVDWLENSPQGKYVNSLDNNHGTWFDVQLVSCHLFLGNEGRARQILETVGERRIAKQIEPDGTQPAELARAKPYDYCLYNLNAFLTLCEIGKTMNVDVFGYASPSGASIGKALSFLEEDDRAGVSRNKQKVNRMALDRFLQRARRLRDSR